MANKHFGAAGMCLLVADKPISLELHLQLLPSILKLVDMHNSCLSWNGIQFPASILLAQGMA